MSSITEPDIDAEYRQLREECGLVDRSDRIWIEVEGDDAAEYLQSQVTNDTEAIETGSGAYAALLDRKGHLQADMRILRLGERSFLLDTEEVAGAALLKHLSMYKIGRKVEVSETHRALFSLIGPGAVAVTGITQGAENRFTLATIAGVECIVAGTLYGQDVICSPDAAEAVRAQLESERAIPVSVAAAEIIRLERGRPRFGAEMTSANMPAEAGIVDRAISFTKGCYIGQEPVARLHYKGRPNRHLRGLRPAGAVAAGDTVRLETKELGTIGSAALSPASGRIAMAILRKEAEPGTTVTVETADGAVDAEVVDLPFVEDTFV